MAQIALVEPDVQLFTSLFVLPMNKFRMCFHQMTFTELSAFSELRQNREHFIINNRYIPKCSGKKEISPTAFREVNGNKYLTSVNNRNVLLHVRLVIYLLLDRLDR